MDTRSKQEWARACRQAWRQVHRKRANHGHVTRECPWTWPEFRGWFQAHLEKGVELNVHHLTSGDWLELLRGCKRGMMVPRKAPF